MSKTSWGHVAGWYDEHLKEEGTYHKEVILPNLIRLLNIKKEDTVLDIACGNGFFAKEIASRGAKVFGTDISGELVEKAKKNVPNATFYVVSADKKSPIKDGSVDKIIVVLAIQNIQNISDVWKECFRVLKPSGSLFVVMNHPIFRIPKASSWGYDSEAGVQYRRIDSYMSESKEGIVMNPGSAVPTETFSFHRPLQVYSKTIANAGGYIARIEEWISHKESQNGPRKKAEDTARKEIPLFMTLEIKKI